VKNPHVPPLLDSLIVQLMNKAAGDRPSSASEVLERLESGDLLRPETEADKKMQVIDRITRGRFVGRDHELAVVKELWNNSLLRKPQTLVISGEPGVGKTRLTRELATYVEVTRGRALIGTCYAEGTAPYSPFAQIIRRALRLVAKEGIEISDFVLVDLLTLTPDLRPHYPELPPNPPLEPQAEQQRLFANIVSFFSSVSTTIPLLLVIDDVQWADSASLSLFRHLSRMLRAFLCRKCCLISTGNA
jgi:predicted ATPase